MEKNKMPRQPMGITTRDRQLLDCLISGWSPRDIQEEFGYTHENSAYTAISRLRSKLKLDIDKWDRNTVENWNFALLHSYIACVIKIKKSESGELVLSVIPNSPP